MAPAAGLGWRFAVLGGLAGGLAVSPFGPTPPLWAGAGALAALAVARPRATGIGLAVLWWLGCVALAAAALGISVGAHRVAAIDGGALDLAPGSRVRVAGFVAAVPRRADGEVRVQVETADGRLLVVATEPVGDLPVGGEVRAAGTIRDPAAWEAGYLERLGIADVLAAVSLERTAGRRGGLPGVLDRVRSRAEAALGRGTEPPAAALLRGFVLGEDDRIDAVTVDQFKRSGLAHLLAVSGQNVVLLAILAGVVLAMLGVPLRARLLWILAAIVVYVPVAGGGASIQRAGIMGAAGVVAALSSRPRSRWYALLLAAAGTLLLNPRATGDVGWQLSFAAVVGILALATPLARTLGRGMPGMRGVLAEAGALSVAATLATAPLLAYHFGTAAALSLPANLLALPAVAPVMWLGMLSAALGQFAAIPVEPVTWLAGLCAGAIAQVAAWFAEPGWATVDVTLPSAAAVGVLYAAIGLLIAVGARWAARRRLGSRAQGRIRRRREAVAAAVVVLAALLAVVPRSGSDEPPSDGLLVRVLDVGQGDAILLQPAGAAPVLVDAGAPGAGVADRLAELGISRLGAIVATHPSLDHLGGIPEVLGRFEVARVVFARLERRLLGLVRAANADPTRVTAGDRWRYGGVRFEVLWPPDAGIRAARAAGGGPAAGDPNRLALVLLVRWGSFAMLLTADAEAELAPVDPGRIDVLKVAHHGSEDPGLAGLLERARPRLGVISVGAENRYGHPAPATLAALAEAGTSALRTDLDGEITVEVHESGWYVR